MVVADDAKAHVHASTSLPQALLAIKFRDWVSLQLRLEVMPWALLVCVVAAVTGHMMCCRRLVT